MMQPWIGSHSIRLFLAWSLSALVLGWLLLTLSAARGGAAALPNPAATVTAWRAISGQVAWQADGVPVCTVDGNQERPEITSDGDGGAIIVWQDERNSSTAIYAQRVYSDGTSAWTTDGVRLSTRSGWWPQITGDGADGAIVSWENGDIYAQRVYSDGTLAWTTNGISLCVASGGQWYTAITGDGAGGAIVAWEDERSGNADIYIQRVYSDGPLAWGPGGTLAWVAGGISLTAAPGDQGGPKLTRDGAGGAIVAWHGGCGGTSGICAQRVRPDGRPAWATGGVFLCTGSGAWPKVTSDGAGGAVVVWEDSRSGNVDLYVQRVYSDGTLAWAANGIPVSIAPGAQRYPVLVGDGAGGAIIVWQDERSGWNAPDVYAQRVYSNGAVAWTTDGLVIAEDARYSHWHPDLTGDGAGGAIITWEGPSGWGPHVYAQRVQADGTLAWKADGVSVCVTAYEQLSPRIVDDGASGAIVVWEDNRRWYKTDEIDIYVQRVAEIVHRFYLPLVLRNA